MSSVDFRPAFSINDADQRQAFDKLKHQQHMTVLRGQMSLDDTNMLQIVDAETNNTHRQIMMRRDYEAFVRQLCNINKKIGGSQDNALFRINVETYMTSGGLWLHIMQIDVDICQVQLQNLMNPTNLYQQRVSAEFQASLASAMRHARMDCSFPTSTKKDEPKPFSPKGPTSKKKRGRKSAQAASSSGNEEELEIPGFNSEEYTLYQHQIDAIKFMLDIEDKIVSGENVLKVYPVIPLGRDSDYVLDLDHGVVMLREKMEDSDHPALETHFRGGMLSSTVGSGKTVSALSVIAARRNQNYHTAMCSTLDMEYLIQTNASLIVTPNNIPRQWYDQLKKFFGDVHDIIADRHVTIPKSRNPIKVLLLLDQRNLKKTTVQDVIDADIIITTIQLLSNEPYISNMQSTFYAAQVAPMDEETEQIDLSEINNENIAKAAKKRRKKNDDGASSSTDGASQQSISAQAKRIQTLLSKQMPMTHDVEYHHAHMLNPFTNLMKNADKDFVEQVMNPPTNAFSEPIDLDSDSDEEEYERRRKTSKPKKKTTASTESKKRNYSTAFLQSRLISLHNFYFKSIFLDEIHRLVAAVSAEDRRHLNSIEQLNACVCWLITGTPDFTQTRYLTRYARMILYDRHPFHQRHEMRIDFKHGTTNEGNTIPVHISLCLEMQRRCVFGVDNDLSAANLFGGSAPLHHVHWIQLSSAERALINEHHQDPIKKQVQLCSDFRVDDTEAGDNQTMSSVMDQVMKQKQEKVSLIKQQVEQLKQKLERGNQLNQLLNGQMNDGMMQILSLLSQTGQNQYSIHEEFVQNKRTWEQQLKEWTQQLTREEKAMQFFQRNLDRMTGQHNNNDEQQQQEDDDDDATCPICYDHAPDCMLRDCGHTFGHSCLTKYFEVAPRKICPMCKCPVLNPQTDIIRVDVSAANNNNSGSFVVDPNSSSKIIALTNFLKSLSRRPQTEDGDDIDDDEEDDNRERALVFVQWTSLARRICKMLNANGVKAKMVIGNAFHRIAAIREFNEGKVDVLLLALDSDDNSGMDLTKANHIVFAHVVMAANEEQRKIMLNQAVARAHRIGQTKQVHVHHFVVQSSVEQKLFEDQKIQVVEYQ